MKIIKPSPFADEWTMQVTCPRCKAVLEVNKNDLTVNYYDDQREGSYYSCHATCISCHHLVSVNAPRDLLEYLYKTRGNSNSSSSYYDYR
jgi:hypothetical protein